MSDNYSNDYDRDVRRRAAGHGSVQRSSVRSASGRRTEGNTTGTATRNTTGRSSTARNAAIGNTAARSAAARTGRSQEYEYYEENSRYSGQAGTRNAAQAGSRNSTQTTRRTSASGNRPNPNAKGRKNRKENKKKKNKIVLFVIEFLILAILLLVFWLVNQGTKVDYVSIKDDDIVIDEQVKEQTETGAMKGYRNIALFGVDSRNGELNKNTRTDTIMIASINQDTKEVKLVSVFRDTYLNLSNDSYNKANSAYAKGGPQQAINMLNMNLDLNITDFVTIGFEGLVDVIDAVGGIEIDVKESEIVHLNNYQISMAGKESGKNAAGEASYEAQAGVDYIPVKQAGVQTLNGLQATAYCRIRYVGNDYERARRQRTVLAKVAEKAKTFDIAKLNKIATAIFGETATSLELDEIIGLLAEASQYTVGESDGFPFEEFRDSGTVGKKGSCVVPVDLVDNVAKLHEFLFAEEEYTPSDTVKQCSEKIHSDTYQYIN